MATTPGQETFSRIEAVANENKASLAMILVELRALRKVADSNAVRLNRVEQTFERVREALVPQQKGRFKIATQTTESVTDSVFRKFLESTVRD